MKFRSYCSRCTQTEWMLFNFKKFYIFRILSCLWVIVIFLASKRTEIGINLASACISRGRPEPWARGWHEETGWGCPRLCTSQTQPGLASRRVITNRQNLRKVTSRHTTAAQITCLNSFPELLLQTNTNTSTWHYGRLTSFFMEDLCMKDLMKGTA